MHIFCNILYVLNCLSHKWVQHFFFNKASIHYRGFYAFLLLPQRTFKITKQTFYKDAEVGSVDIKLSLLHPPTLDLDICSPRTCLILETAASENTCMSGCQGGSIAFYKLGLFGVGVWCVATWRIFFLYNV